VVLLHGFPEFWYAWRNQIPALADAGYRVVAPDLPGYNTSDKPPRVRDYRPRLLVQEVVDLIVALVAGSAAVAGHDRGGGLAWLLAMRHPKQVQRLVILNTPHPIRFLKGLRSPRQLVHPRLPAPLDARAGRTGPGLPALRRALRHQPTRPDVFTAQDIDATSPRPPSQAAWAPLSTTTRPPSAPTRWRKRIPCAAWTPRP
jgi:epoxide hydrolase 4